MGMALEIRVDPVTGLKCRSDGAIYHPGSVKRPAGWTYGTPRRDGYLLVSYGGVSYCVHRLVCQAFHGLAPEGKPSVDHINRDKSDNRSTNLRWLSQAANVLNSERCDKSFAAYGVRCKDDPTAFQRAYLATHPEQVERNLLQQRNRYAANREQCCAKQRNRYAANPEQAERHRTRARERYAMDTAVRKRILAQCQERHAKERLDPKAREVRNARAQAYREKMRAQGFVEHKGHKPHWVKKEILTDSIGDNA